MDIELDEENYRMDHKKKGLCLIIDIRDFNKERTGLETRTGTDVDAANLYELFSGLGFEVRLEQNKTVKEMVLIFNEVACQDHTNSDCLVCAILSHGHSGLVYGTDGELTVETIASMFNGNRCCTLAGKPKVFIIQAGREHQYDSDVEQADALPGEPQPEVYRIPEMADFLYAYSTVSGYHYRCDQPSGSWFIQALCQIFKKDYGDDTKRDIVTMLTRVNRVVAYEFELNNKELRHMKQVPSIISMLTKQPYL